jgi:hypothetical protein
MAKAEKHKRFHDLLNNLTREKVDPDLKHKEP